MLRYGYMLSFTRKTRIRGIEYCNDVRRLTDFQGATVLRFYKR